MIKHRKAIEDLQPYIPGKPISEVQRELGITEIVKLASNENPLGCSPKATAAVRSWAENMALYPDSNCTELRLALSEKLGLEAEQLLFGAGSDEILELITQAWLNPGENTIIGSPSFSRYESATKIMDGKTIEVPLTIDYRFDLKAMEESINEKTKIIWICNPNNPTGTIITRQEQEAFLEKVPRNILVVLDEAYYEYARGGDYPESVELLKEYHNIIILRTFSKAYGLAGLRIGYAISNREIISYINRVRGPFNVNAAAQVAALAALEDDEFIKSTVETNEKGKRFLYEALESMGLSYIPTYTNFIMVKVNQDSRKVFSKLLQLGVIVRSGDIFGMTDWIRVTIGTPRENQLFIQSLKKVL